MRDVNLKIGVIDDDDFIYFDFDDEITTSKQFIEFVTYMKRHHLSPCINKCLGGGGGYRMISTHNLNIRKHKVNKGDTFIADITFYKNNHLTSKRDRTYFPYVRIKNTSIDPSCFVNKSVSNNE